MIAVKNQYEAWQQLLRGVAMSANLGKGGFSVSPLSLAKKHAEHAAEAITGNFGPRVQTEVRIGLERWITAHLEVATEPTTERVLELRNETDRLARILVVNGPPDEELRIGPAMSSLTRIEILSGRLEATVDRFIELLAAKIEKKGIRKAQQETKLAAESVARFAAEWLI